MIGGRVVFGKKSKRIRELEDKVERLRMREWRQTQLLNASLDRENQLLERIKENGNDQQIGDRERQTR